jgi:hypothetical protein
MFAAGEVAVQAGTADARWPREKPRGARPNARDFPESWRTDPCRRVSSCVVARRPTQAESTTEDAAARVREAAGQPGAGEEARYPTGLDREAIWYKMQQYGLVTRSRGGLPVPTVNSDGRS